MKPLGTLLRDTRINRGMTQREIADHLGFQTQSISNWERESAGIPTKHLPKLMSLLDLSQDDILAAAQLTYAKRVLKKLNTIKRQIGAK